MINNPQELLTCIETLDEEHAYTPIYLYDEQGNWYGMNYIELKLRPAIDDQPPNTYYELHIRKYYTGPQKKYELNHRMPIREIYHLLDETLNDIHEGDADLMDAVNAIHDALHKLCEYDDVYTHELTPTQRKTYLLQSSELIDPLNE